MRVILSTVAVLTVALSILTACQQNATTTTDAAQKISAPPEANKNQTAPVNTPKDDAPRISLADAKKDFDAGAAVFVDTRDSAAFKAEHIKDAINISLDVLEAKYKEIPTGKKIIVYCS